MSYEQKLQALSESQHGVFNLRGAHALGVRSDEIYRLRKRGLVTELSATVFRYRGAPDSDDAKKMAAVLDAGAGAAISHWSAAFLWGLPVPDPATPHVTAPGRSARRGEPIGIRHEPRTPLTGHRVIRNSIPVTTPSCTLFDLASLPEMYPDRLERLVDAALARQLTTVPRLRWTLNEIARRGRRGIVQMREFIEERESDFTPVESGLEFRFADLAKRVGLRGFERQVDIGGADGDWIGRVDFFHRERRIVVECDTALHHGALSDQRRDHVRRERYEREGIAVVAITDVDVFYRPDDVVEKLQALLRSRQPRQLAG